MNDVMLMSAAAAPLLVVQTNVITVAGGLLLRTWTVRTKDVLPPAKCGSDRRVIRTDQQTPVSKCWLDTRACQS